MRVLFVTPYVPSIVRIRPYALIRELARLGHQVTLACLVQPEWEARYISDVKVYCEEVQPVALGRLGSYLHTLASLPTRLPMSVAYCRSAAFEHLVENLAQSGKFDIMHAEFIRTTPTTRYLVGLPKVYDAVDSLALAYERSYHSAMVPWKQRLVSWFEWAKLRDYEQRVLKDYDCRLASSPVDAQALEAPGLKVEVLSNGVDLDFFRFQEKPRQPGTIIFLGKMSYYVNIASVLWFYHQVLPLVRQGYPQAQFKIIGREPASKIQALSSDPAVEVTGTVPDVRPFLEQATLAVCPMICGSGIQNKMLEAMASGTPCVSTSLASQALQVQPGREILVADDPEDFARAVLELLASAPLRRQLAENGRLYVERNHDWKEIGQQLNTIYCELSHSKE